MRIEEERRKHFSALNRQPTPTQQVVDRPPTQQVVDRPPTQQAVDRQQTQQGGELKSLMQNVIGELVRAKEERTRAEPPTPLDDHPAPTSQQGDDHGRGRRSEEEEEWRRQAQALLDEPLSLGAVSSDRWTLSGSSHGTFPDPTRRAP